MSIIEIGNLSDIDLSSISDISTTDSSNITEQMYLDMSNDFRNRMKQKNRRIRELQIKLIIIYALVERFMDTGDEAFIEETRLILDKSLNDDIGIQEID